MFNSKIMIKFENLELSLFDNRQVERWNRIFRSWFSNIFQSGIGDFNRIFLEKWNMLCTRNQLQYKAMEMWIFRRLRVFSNGCLFASIKNLFFLLRFQLFNYLLKLYLYFLFFFFFLKNEELLLRRKKTFLLGNH